MILEKTEQFMSLILFFDQDQMPAII